MTHQELYSRLAVLAERIVPIAEPLLERRVSRQAAEQLLDCSSSAAANYRAAGQARSHAEFLSKLGVALEEADETGHWLEYLANTGLSADAALPDLLREARELTRILGASRRTARLRAAESRRLPRPPARSR